MVSKTDFKQDLFKLKNELNVVTHLLSYVCGCIENGNLLDSKENEFKLLMSWWKAHKLRHKIIIQ